MKREHLTPDGWKPCTATTKGCKFAAVRIADSSTFIDSAVEEFQSGKQNAIQNFFTILFGSAKTNSTRTDSKIKPQVTPEPTIDTPILNEVVQGDDGQYQVACKDVWQNRILIHKFGDLIKNKEAAKRLHKADLRKDYQLGECGVIAGELWNCNKHVAEYYMLKTASDPQFGTHHFVQLNDGTYADSLGIWTEEAFLSHWKTIDPTVEIATFDEENEPESRNPNITISNPELFNTVNELIEKHMNGDPI